MSRHRLNVEPEARPTERVTPEPASTIPTPTGGKRRAAVPTATESVAPTTYVGKRRATPRPETVLDHSVPTTAELYAIADRTLEETAPRPRMTPALLGSVEALVPAPRRSTEHTAAPANAANPANAADAAAPTAPEPAPITMPATDDTAIAIPRVDPVLHPLQATLSDTAIALPRVTLADDLDHDLLTQTASLHVATGGRRRKAETAKRSLRGLPSLPVAAGVAALAIAVAGVVTTGHAIMSPASSRTVVQASALGGVSGSATVGNRGPALSRDADRTQIDQAAAQRTQALTQADKQAGSYDAYLKKNQWGLPIEAGDYHLTARFGDVSGLWQTVHTGLDFACPTGTPIHAVAAGTITQIGWAGAYGNRTVETLPDGTELWYAHQSAFGAHVGEKVTEGEVIGFVGATGNVTGPHVHLEVRPGGGDPVDPDAALKAHGIDPDAHQG